MELEGHAYQTLTEAQVQNLTDKETDRHYQLLEQLIDDVRSKKE